MEDLSHPKYQFVQDPENALSKEELLGLLEDLLAAERAGVKAAAALREDHPPGPTRAFLDALRGDEAESCRLLMESIRTLGREPAARTGDFLEKALSVQGAPERSAFLQRGQRWVVRRLQHAIPRVGDPEVADALRRMLSIHDANIAACAEILGSSPAPQPTAERRG